ncbi:hypothetical protein FHL15_005487 [Xylaria flabelliformis]|uniref:Uncharacterized protein n=1 Tax=Xylaria flabelliformis TaxID=2512241 RepID=A0A553I012_9PEZI|nr:hypothetical protein FHL15_005487 [Xylaria flabelliformis]
MTNRPTALDASIPPYLGVVPSRRDCVELQVGLSELTPSCCSAGEVELGIALERIARLRLAFPPAEDLRVLARKTRNPRREY